MKSLHHLDNSVLNAVKVALDGYQRFEQHDSQRYFYRLLDYLIGPLVDLNVWALRDMINSEDDRRIKRSSVRVADGSAYEAIKLLGEQELKVLLLIGEGHRSEAIASLLSISLRTVHNHKQNITHKLKLGSASDLPRFAVEYLEHLR